MDQLLNRLQARKQKIEEIIHRKQEYMMTPLTDTIDELSFYDQHPADIGSETYEREKDMGLLELMEFELEKVNDALEQYQQGKYGICEVCGQPIDPRRLERLINTTLCVHCAREQENRFTPPAEEDVLFPGMMSDRGEAFEIAEYDFYDTNTPD